MDPESMNIAEVELIVDNTKSQINDKIDEIKKLGDRIKREDGCNLGVIVVCIGWMIDDMRMLTAMGVPLSDK